MATEIADFARWRAVGWTVAEHFVAQGQMVGGFVAGEFGDAAYGIAGRGRFVSRDVFRSRSAYRAGISATPPLFFFNLFNRTHPRLCLTDGEFGDLPKSTFGSVPQFQRVARFSCMPCSSSLRFSWSVCLWSDLGTAGLWHGQRGQRRFCRTRRRFFALSRRSGTWLCRLMKAATALNTAWLESPLRACCCRPAVSNT